MRNECVVLVFGARLCSGLLQFNGSVVTGGAQRGPPLALDQADPDPDITSRAAASPSLGLCCTVQ